MPYQVRDLPVLPLSPARPADGTRDAALVDHVERSLAAVPTCRCGRTTTVVQRDGALRLTCPALAEPAPGRFGRLMALTSAVFHVDEYLADAPATAREVAPAVPAARTGSASTPIDTSPANRPQPALA